MSGSESKDMKNWLIQQQNPLIVCYFLRFFPFLSRLLLLLFVDGKNPFFVNFIVYSSTSQIHWEEERIK